MKTATRPSMKFIPMAAVLKHKARIQAKFADAAQLLRAADDKLGQVQDEFDDDARSNVYPFDVIEARLTVRLLADLIDTEERSTQSAACSAIASHPNEKPGNTPHLEGVIMAALLAEKALESGLELAGQFDGDDVDERYEVQFAAWSIVKGIAASLGCKALTFDPEKALEALVPARRTLALAA